MSVHLLCITSNSGLPIFTRKRGEGDALPFSVVASLNGVHMFTKSQGVTIKSTSTEDTTLVWEEFEESLVLIGSGTRASEWIIRRLLRAAFGAMVLLVGLEEIRLIRNADRFKRELRVCYPLLDVLMDAVDSVSSGSSKNNSAGTLLGLSEAILCPEHSVLLSCLESYASCIDSSFACLLAHGRQVVSTPAWSDLHPLERQLLATLVVTGGLCSSSDVPVFLPYKSPSVAFRLVSILVVRDVYVMALCGPTPSLAEAEHLTVQCWAACIDHLHNARSIVPNNIPLSLTFDSGVLGFLIIRTDVGKYVLSSGGSALGAENVSRDLRCPTPSSGHRADVLRTFYHQAAAPLLLGVDQLDNAVTPNIGEHTIEDPSLATGDRALETYWCSEYHKCHGVRIKDNVLCVLYAASVPTHTMRLLTQKTYKFLTTEKQLGW